MRLAPLALVLGIAACGNPHQVWIAENGSEAMLKLDDSEPSPF